MSPGPTNPGGAASALRQTCLLGLAPKARWMLQVFADGLPFQLPRRPFRTHSFARAIGGLRLDLLSLAQWLAEHSEAPDASGPRLRDSLTDLAENLEALASPEHRAEEPWAELEHLAATFLALCPPSTAELAAQVDRELTGLIADSEDPADTVAMDGGTGGWETELLRIFRFAVDLSQGRVLQSRPPTDFVARSFQTWLLRFADLTRPYLLEPPEQLLRPPGSDEPALWTPTNSWRLR